MKVKKISIKNLKAVDKMQADFNGCTAIITGGNNKGKSTFLKSFVDRIRGSKNPDIIKEGEKEGSCEYELTDGSKFVWSMKGKTEKLSFITQDGMRIEKGVVKEIGKRFFGNGFDIDNFLTSTPKKQQEVLQKILDIDLTEIETEYKLAYDDRTLKNSLMKTEQAKFREPTDETQGFEYINIKEKEEELTEKEVNNEKINSVSRELNRFKNDLTEVEEQMKLLEEKRTALLSKIDRGEKRVKENAAADITKEKTEIEEMRAKNKIIRENIEAKEQQERIKDAEHNWNVANDKVKELDEMKKNIIKQADVPEGFEFTDDGLTYNGYELDKSKLSSSAIYIASLKLASKGLGEIKTLTFDASFLDRNSLEEIEERANKNDLQLLIERPDFDGGELKYELLHTK